MRDAVFFEGDEAPRRFSRFWLLLVLSSVIAAAGVVADSDATVIGAMIVAPLMTPILGIVLATVLGDRANLLRSWGLVFAGAATAIAIGYGVGLLVAAPVIASTDPQVAQRVAPDLIDLLAALATGAVGVIALVRSDISDTLPGVAIAISLVPPLTVVGLTLESQAWDQALGALLLFATNVAAILASGVVVLAVYRIRARADAAAARPVGEKQPSPRRSIVFIAATLLIIAVPLTVTSLQATQQTALESEVRAVVAPWAEDHEWELAAVTTDGDTAQVTLTGSVAQPDTASLSAALEDAGVDPAKVTAQFVPAHIVQLGPPG
ncbi:DUF389 domain-containing protein [Microbacterium sp. SSM24]|uniref:DUF389 domain-containing protein n=1 Tax=Microbacterium sp. SSM24 TaxID=2991714 RepID=UPI002227818B|nr:DUF389 domain-containing protein [Microbacterium sp. SSM24]MCW3493616.1 DUF389 domain-containing protein [Microbacterium sp. SSM24]